MFRYFFSGQPVRKKTIIECKNFAHCNMSLKFWEMVMSVTKVIPENLGLLCINLEKFISRYAACDRSPPRVLECCDWSHARSFYRKRLRNNILGNQANPGYKNHKDPVPYTLQTFRKFIFNLMRVEQYSLRTTPEQMSFLWHALMSNFYQESARGRVLLPVYGSSRTHTHIDSLHHNTAQPITLPRWRLWRWNFHR